MKRISKGLRGIAMLLMSMLSAGMALAQDDTVVDAYDTAPRHNPYLQYIGPAILAILIIYVSYRYWQDNRPHHDHTGHAPHHP